MPAPESPRVALQRALARALDAGGCPKPAPTAAFLVECVKSGNNPALVSLQEGPDRIAASTFSERLGKVDLKGFLRRFNAQLEEDLYRSLRRWRPTHGDVFALLDGHEEEHWAKAGPHKCHPRRCRAHWAHAAHGKNKRSPTVQLWLVLALTWRHGNRWITQPVRLDLLGRTENSPHGQIEIIARLLRRLGLRVRALLLDRAYDSKRVHEVAHAYGLRVGVRVRLGHARAFPRNVYVDGESEPSRLHRLVEGTAQDRKLPLGASRDRAGRWFVHRTRVLRVRFSPEGPLVDLTISAGLKPLRGPTFRWAFDPDHTILLAFPVGTGAKLSRRLYRLRWHVETLFNLWSQDRPQPRPKTIHAHVVQFCAFAYRMCLAAALQFTERLRASSSVSGVAPARLTLRVAARWVLEPD